MEERNPYEERAVFKMGDGVQLWSNGELEQRMVTLETKGDDLYICLPSGCVSVPATGENIAKWLTFFEEMANGAG